MQGYGASPPPLAAIFDPPSPTPSIDLPEYDFSPGYGPEPNTYLDLPTPTPALSDENLEHFMPSGYGPVPGLEPLPQEEEIGAPLAAEALAFDLNVKVEPEDEETGALYAAAPFAFDLNVKVEPEDEESFVAAPASPPSLAPQPARPPTPPPETRRILRQFAAAMASVQPGFHAGSWNPTLLGFSNVAMPNASLPDGSTDEERCGGSCSRRW
jgi:hypothetical protein